MTRVCQYTAQVSTLIRTNPSTQLEITEQRVRFDEVTMAFSFISSTQKLRFIELETRSFSLNGLVMIRGREKSRRSESGVRNDKHDHID